MDNLINVHLKCTKCGREISLCEALDCWRSSGLTSIITGGEFYCPICSLEYSVLSSFYRKVKTEKMLELIDGFDLKLGNIAFFMRNCMS